MLVLIQPVHLHPSCCLETQPEWVIFNEFVLTSRHYIRTVTEIRPGWLLGLATDYYDLRTFPDGDAKRSLQRVSNALERLGTSKMTDLDIAMLKINSMKLS
jgi:hypothetical protein